MRTLNMVAAVAIALTGTAVSMPIATAAPLVVAPSNGIWGGSYASPTNPDPILLFDDAVSFRLRSRVVSGLSFSTHMQCLTVDTGQRHKVAFDFRDGYPDNRPGAGFPDGRRIPAGGVLRVAFAAFSYDGFWSGTARMIFDFSMARPQVRFSFVGEDANPDGTEPASHNEQCFAQRKHVTIQRLRSAS